MKNQRHRDNSTEYGKSKKYETHVGHKREIIKHPEKITIMRLWSNTVCEYTQTKNPPGKLMCLSAGNQDL